MGAGHGALDPGVRLPKRVRADRACGHLLAGLFVEVAPAAGCSYGMRKTTWASLHSSSRL